MRKLEKDALLADRDAVENILSSIPAEDVIGQMSFRSRLGDIDKQLEELSHVDTTIGTVALLFGGRPTHGSRAIDADFASQILKTYQDLITKRIATDEVGRLGARGPVPFQTQTTLAITEVVRGSVGFVLEEFSDNESLVATAVKQAMDDVTEIIRSTSANQSDEFERTIESVGPRFFSSLKDFFITLDDKAATIRIVDDTHDEALDLSAIKRGRQRVETTEIEELEDETVVGRLLGLFPRGRKFEFELADTGEVIHGGVAAALTPRYDALLADRETVPIGRKWRVRMRIRRVRELNRPDRSIYTLIGLLDEVSD